MGQGRGEEGKEEVKKATFPTLLTMIVAKDQVGAVVSGELKYRFVMCFLNIAGLCDIQSIPWSLGVYCAAALRILAHDDSRVKAKIVGRGGLSNVLKMCEPKAQSNDIGN